MDVHTELNLIDIQRHEFELKIGICKILWASFPVLHQKYLEDLVQDSMMGAGEGNINDTQPESTYNLRICYGGTLD